MKLKTAIQQTQEATPVAALAVFGLFVLILGVFYFFKNRRKIRRAWRKMTRRKHFWGYVTAAGLFILFGGYFLFLGFDDR